ncbi:hypothetical protein [Mesorhizobium sp. SP-1A]|uniref:hypothetical protein n=1 Tax=Mesorhizobium sp. SP-1A TaxID=3077840 RepID=UPI0028F70A55|nr:hypothetical protein [Mesorhizobium sp. SP-1A]
MNEGTAALAVHEAKLEGNVYLIAVAKCTTEAAGPAITEDDGPDDCSGEPDCV